MALPTFIRFKDLKARGIVDSWPQLGRLMRDRGFPRGIMLGANTRAWTTDEVADWLGRQPVGNSLKLPDDDRRAAL